MEYLDNLNKYQKEATIHMDGPCLVVAGAGSGKTKVLTTRIANLISNGINSYNILAITFTNKAANEMRTRVENMIGKHNAFVGTFHSFGLRIIRDNYEKVGLTTNFTIIDTEDVNSVIKKILKRMDIDPEDVSPAFIRNRISFIKNNMLSASEIEKYLTSDAEGIAIKVYYEYEKVLKRNNTIDFDDLLVKPVELFKNNRDILEHYQDKYKYILIDEYQDTNEVQYKLVQMLASKYRNLFVVGDPSQSIYSFRGANFQNILNFEKDYPDAKVYKLPQNYRSTQIILDAANDVIKNNRQRKDIDLFSDLGEGVKIKYIRSFDNNAEGNRIISEIKDLELQGYHRKDIAVFYRTNSQSRSIEEKFIHSSIPYKVYGSYYFYKRKEIKDLIAYLKLLINHNDDISLERVINEPKRKIGEKTIEKLFNLAGEKNCSVFEVISEGKELEFKNIILTLEDKMKDLSLVELIDEVLNDSGLREYYEKEDTLESEVRLDNLEEFKSSAAAFEKSTGSVNLNDFLEQVELVSDAAEYSEDSDAVSLMTIHSAKGLEFKCVFIVGLEENLLPHSQSLLDENELEEERRLMYVAITRAKERLYLMNAEKRVMYGKEVMNMPSRFISEIREELLDKENKNSKLFHQVKKELLYNDEEDANNDFKKGELVHHLTFGNGVITNIDDRFITIAFKIGVKKLLKNYKGLRKVG